jgi:hypothetical protein
MPKVKGSVSTTAMVMVKPGMAPATRPASTPTDISSRLYGVTTETKAPATFSMSMPVAR